MAIGTWSASLLGTGNQQSTCSRGLRHWSCPHDPRNSLVVQADSDQLFWAGRRPLQDCLCRCLWGTGFKV